MTPLEVDEVARAIGILGLIVAVAGLVWQVVQFRLARDRIRVSAHWGFDSLGVGGIPGWRTLVVDVRNIGRAPVDMTGIDIETPGQPWPQDFSGPQLPVTIAPGTHQEFKFRESDLTSSPPVKRVRPLVQLVTGTVCGRWIAGQDACP